MQRRLVLCLDGTWNTYKDHTNVSRLHAMVPNLPDAQKGGIQLKYYDEGVGTHWYDRLRGGISGAGLSRNIRQAYEWLMQHYTDDAEIFVFGFSRGAYTARSLVGLIARCGIPQARGSTAALSERAHAIYRASRTDDETARQFRARESRAARIRFLGVWDTVGALGVPSLQIAEKFHHTALCDNVDNAYHALAIDEHRKAYEAVLWTDNPGGAQVEQRWFPGAHANIGGGYEDDLLPDISLKWMLEKAHACGLHLGQRGGTALQPDDLLPLDGQEYCSPVRDSFGEFMSGAYAALRFGARHYRPIGRGIAETIDASAFRKWKREPDYRPFNLAHADHAVSSPALGDDAGAAPGTP